MEAGVGQLMAVRAGSGWLHHPRGVQEAVNGTINEVGL